jgi:phosphoesterase RecJ-like protein
MDNLIDKKQIELFNSIVEEAQKIVIVPHVNPDGDAIGAALGLWQALKNMKKHVNVVVPNDFPEFLQWINGSSKVLDFEKAKAKAQETFDSADTLIVVDFNDFERAEHMSETLLGFKGTKVMIDHHPQPVAKCELLISYPEISSTCELIFRILTQAGKKQFIDVNSAEAIFTGMMTDTGNFSYNANTPDTYHIIGELLEKGIDKDKVHANVYHTFSENRWRLIGHSLKDKMVILPEYNTGYISLSADELAKFDFQPGDTEGLVNYPLMVKDIVFSVLFTEKDDLVKLSLRSKGEFSSNQFAREHFNGGGHNNAAGGKTTLKIDEAVEKFRNLLPQYLSSLKS